MGLLHKSQLSRGTKIESLDIVEHHPDKRQRDGNIGDGIDGQSNHDKTASTICGDVSIMALPALVLESSYGKQC